MNQVLFGLTVGIAFAFIGHFKVKPLFLNMPEAAYSNVGGSSYVASCKWYCILIFLSCLIPAGMIFTLYILKIKFSNQDVSLHTDPTWRKVMLLSSCSAEDLSIASSLQHLHVLKSSRVMLGFGAVFGQFFEWQFFVNTGDLRTSHWTWWQSSIGKIICRTFVTAFVLSIPLSALFFLPRVIDEIPNEQLKFYLRFSCLYSLTYFITAFVAFSILRQMFYRVGLDNSAAVGKAF